MSKSWSKEDVWWVLEERRIKSFRWHQKPGVEAHKRCYKAKKWLRWINRKFEEMIDVNIDKAARQTKQHISLLGSKYWREEISSAEQQQQFQVYFQQQFQLLKLQSQWPRRPLVWTRRKRRPRRSAQQETGQKRTKELACPNGWGNFWNDKAEFGIQ